MGPRGRDPGTRFVERIHVVGDAIHFAFPTKNLGTFMTDEQMPIFLVVADTTKKEAYFQFLQGFADAELDEMKWANQDSVTIRVPLETAYATTNASGALSWRRESTCWR